MRRIPRERRLEELYRRLNRAKPAATAEEALILISETLREVVNDLSGIPERTPPPPPTETDDRMYPPQDDFITRLADGSLTAHTKGHIIQIDTAGSFWILNRNGETVFEKAGADV